MGGESPRGLPNEGSLGGGKSPNWNQPRGPHLDPHVGIYGWLIFDPRMFMSPWYWLVVIWFEPINKLPYQNFQYPTYLKDINPNAHIRVFKKKSKLMGRLWKLISSTYLVSFYETISRNGAKTLYNIIPIALLRN